jgi:hypothetical protein
MADCSSNHAMHLCAPRITRTVPGTRLGRLVLAGSVAVGLVSAGAGCASAASQPSYSWVQASPATSPPGRQLSVMAYDGATSQVVLFSGATGTGPLRTADTWIWDGTTWSRAAPATSPRARQGAVMAYDAATEQLVLFGGATGTRSGLISDTWVWDGTTWSQAAPATSPPARRDASMAYDPATRQLVLFGGVGPAHNSHALKDTWTWNGHNWTQASPVTSPSARFLPSMAYDAAQGGLVLFGGVGPFGSQPNVILPGTWAWNGTVWTKLSPATSPPDRAGASMVYDQATGQDVLFGGIGGPKTILGDTWAWDGSTWNQVTTASSPPQREFPAMAYDGATGQAVLFSGWAGTEPPDTWSLGALTNTPPVNAANAWLNRLGLTLQFLALFFVTPAILGKKKMLKAGKKLTAFSNLSEAIMEAIKEAADSGQTVLSLLGAPLLIVAAILYYRWHTGPAHSVGFWIGAPLLWVSGIVLLIYLVAAIVAPVMSALSRLSEISSSSTPALLRTGAIFFAVGFAVLLAATWIT